MPAIGRRCHELRVPDEGHNWRIIYAVETNAIVVVGVVAKITRKTSTHDIDVWKDRLKRYSEAIREGR
jgi:phage-related protein